MNVELRPMTVHDCQCIVDWNKGKDENYLYQWAGHAIYGFPLTEEQIAARLNEANTKFFMICSESRPIGSYELYQIDTQNSTARVCRFLLCDEMKGKGYGTIALKRLSEMAFRELGLQCLSLGVFAFNVGAIRCYEKAGFLMQDYHERENPKWNSYTMCLDRQRYMKHLCD